MLSFPVQPSGAQAQTWCRVRGEEVTSVPRLPPCPPQPPDPVQPAALQVPPVQRAHQGAAPVHLHQVREPVSGGEGHHPGRAAQRQPAEECRRGAAAAGRGVPAAQHGRQHRHPGRPAAGLPCPAPAPRALLSATLTGLLPLQATVLEEMPPFPERESSILAKLKKKKGPSTVTGLEDSKRERGADINGGPEPTPASAAVGPSLTPGPRTSSQGARSSQVRTSRAFAHWGQCLWNTKVCAMSLAVASSLRPSPVPPWNPRNCSHPDTLCSVV